MGQKNISKAGGTFSQFVQCIQAIGHNVDVDIQQATVTSVNPIEIKMDIDGMTFREDELIISYLLGAHTRVTETGEVIRFRSVLNVGDQVIVACMDDKQQWFLIDKIANKL